MVTLGTAIAESVIHHYGRPALLVAAERSVLVPGARLGDGDGLALLRHHHLGDGRAEEGPQSAGARTRHLHLRRPRPHSRNTPDELRDVAERTSLDGDALVRTSRLTARIDNNAVADGFQIYLHSFVLTADGDWAIVQQGMNEASGLARRYHWHSARCATSPPIRTPRSSAARRHDHEPGRWAGAAGAGGAAGDRRATIPRARLPRSAG